MQQELKMKPRIDPSTASSVMTNFCYAYCRILVDEAKKLRQNNYIFSIAPSKPRPERIRYKEGEGELYGYSAVVLRAIAKQMNLDFTLDERMRTYKEDVDELLEIAERFLSLFEQV